MRGVTEFAAGLLMALGLALVLGLLSGAITTPYVGDAACAPDAGLSPEFGN